MKRSQVRYRSNQSKRNTCKQNVQQQRLLNWLPGKGVLAHCVSSEAERVCRYYAYQWRWKILADKFTRKRLKRRTQLSLAREPEHLFTTCRKPASSQHHKPELHPVERFSLRLRNISFVEHNDIGVSSAYVNFTLRVYGVEEDIDAAFAVTVTTTITISGSYATLFSGEKQVNLP